MNLLQYTSDEMYSSTELIRKSKMVFDKISHKQIEKAVILRDGKPSFIMLDFFQYEKLVQEYMELKKNNIPKKQLENPTTKERIVSPKSSSNSNQTKEEIDEDEMLKALDEIDNLDFDDIEIEKNTNKEEILKDFWE